jgi:Holliday junction resolvase RusA-like endonuclease
MPTSWSKQKKEAMNDQMHQQTPDLDNLAKALFDALFENDCQIHDVRLSKVWGHTGRIEIRETI